MECFHPKHKLRNMCVCSKWCTYLNIKHSQVFPVNLDTDLMTTTLMLIPHTHKPVLQYINGYCFKFATSNKKCCQACPLKVLFVTSYKIHTLVYYCVFHKNQSLKVWWKKGTIQVLRQHVFGFFRPTHPPTSA